MYIFPYFTTQWKHSYIQVYIGWIGEIDPPLLLLLLLLLMLLPSWLLLAP